MNNVPSRFASLVLCTLLCGITACGDDSETTAPPEPIADAVSDAGHQDDSHGGAATCTDGPGVTPVTPDLTEDDSCVLDGSLEGKAFIVNGLVLSRPDDEFLLQILNPVWAGDIATGRLMLLFKVTEHDVDAGTATVRAGSGCADGEGGYGWHVDPSDLKVQITACHFETTEPATLSIWPGSMNKPVMVSDLNVAGHFTPDGSEITGAFLEGALARSDAEGLIGDLDGLEIPIVTFFEDAEVPLDADLDGDGTMDAWGMAGDLSAESTDGGAL